MPSKCVRLLPLIQATGNQRNSDLKVLFPYGEGLQNAFLDLVENDEPSKEATSACLTDVLKYVLVYYTSLLHV